MRFQTSLFWVFLIFFVVVNNNKPSISLPVSSSKLRLKKQTSLFGLTPLRFEESYCLQNPFLSTWDKSSFQTAADSLILARTKLIKNSFSDRFAPNWHRFNTAPLSQLCNGELERFPQGTEDGGKLVCSLNQVRSPCVIYSLGSALSFDFELEMIKNTPCDIHTFDCTVDETKVPILPSRIHFSPTCIGEEGANDPKFQSLAKVASTRGHHEIALLKIDIEGFEFDVIESLYESFIKTSGSLILPFQISFELHYGKPHFNVSLTAGEISLLWIQLADLGYVVVSREDNRYCADCSEYTVVRAFC